MSVSAFEAAQLDQISAVLGATNEGLTGGQIGRYLSQLQLPDIYPGSTKRFRLYEALVQAQNQSGNGDGVIAFIETAMNPLRWTSAKTGFSNMRNELNTVLRFCGYELGEGGKVIVVHPVYTLAEAQQRADTLRAILEGRSVHPDLLKFCRAELLQENYFHAVFEATKSVADKIRSKSGLLTDGSELVDKAFGLGSPLIAINSLQTETEQSEQKGFANLLRGMFGVFRNTTAHAPKIKWPIDEQDALDLLSLASYMHRRLDRATSLRLP